MNHTPAINVWKGNNRVSQLWEDLLTDRVSPDPCAGEYLSLDMDQALSFPLEEGSSLTSSGEQNPSPAPSLLEKAGFESLRIFRQALEILTAPPEDDPVTYDSREQDLTVRTAGQGDVVLGMTFIKVSSEPEPQPGSSIDTRRMAYGLKIPMKPLHKRPVYQRVFFCLRHILHPGRDDPSSHR